MTLDRMMVSGGFKGLINSQASELSCPMMYAIMKAYEGVTCEHDWKRPRNASGAKVEVQGRLADFTRHHRGHPRGRGGDGQVAEEGVDPEAPDVGAGRSAQGRGIGVAR
eukprot:3255109-Pyramimonas_sp.AAC.1